MNKDWLARNRDNVSEWNDMSQSKNSLHNLQHDEGGNYMAEAEGIVFFAK
jgi:GrpB-like predicted nucleotidyltransferase (UPF0157 family)